MGKTIRCVSSHAESVVVGEGENEQSVMVPVGETAKNVNLNHPTNERLLAEAKIAVLVKPNRTAQTDQEGDKVE